MSYIEKWKSILARGGLLSLPEVANLLINNEKPLKSVPEAIREMLSDEDKPVDFFTYIEVVSNTQRVVVCGGMAYIDITDMLESDYFGNRTDNLLANIADFLYWENWLG